VPTTIVIARISSKDFWPGIVSGCAVIRGPARGYRTPTTSDSSVIQGQGRESLFYSIIPLWLSSFSSEESMLADTGRFVRASSPKN
jgi:hypothetical protein